MTTTEFHNSNETSSLTAIAKEPLTVTHAKNNSNTGESLLFRKSEDPRLQELNDRLTRSVLANAVQSDTSNFVSSDGSDGILANCNARITFKDK